MLMLLLFSKIYFKNTSISVIFKKTKTKTISLLKAPSRHKKFFHQFFFEFFFLKFFLKKKIKQTSNDTKKKFFFLKKNFFHEIGNNVMVRTKFSTSFDLKKNFLK